MRHLRRILSLLVASGAVLALAAAPASAQQKPNIIMIMGNDVGWADIGVYNQGIMSGRTPNL